jgi:sphingosine kinase
VLTDTEHRGHMTSITKDLDFKYDAIVVLSGDGGIHEVINGLAQRPDGRKALTIPVAQIPTGSANALCVNVLGPKVRSSRATTYTWF